MAEKRTNAEAAGVPAARTGEPESEQRSDPPRKRAVKTAAPGKRTVEKTAQKTAEKTAQKTTKAAGKTAGKRAAPAVPVKPRRPTKATKAAPAEVAEPAKAAPAKAAAPPPVPGAVPDVWAEAAWAALREPDVPPRRLAELVVAELGPRAAAWAGWLRDRYRDPPPYGIARLATRQAGRLGTALAAGAVAGPLVGPPLQLLGLAWVRATVVLRIAAAYGHDPTDPKRADDLIELLDLGHGLSGEPTRLPRWLGPFRLLPLGVELGRRPAAGLYALLTTVGSHTQEIERLAHRAIRRYRTDDTNESISSRNSR